MTYDEITGWIVFAYLGGFATGFLIAFLFFWFAYVREKN